MDIKFEGLSPTTKGIRVGLVVKGKGGWIKFGTLEIPWHALRDRDVVRALLRADTDSEYEDYVTDPLF